ncbi:bifunctional folylpolyglutamate synthase/dihydrofolate synthase [Gulosibacter faecalis]|jgi:dihydrofolate synthase/folylpolyglutamate synthase|uniref:tetrahydrofolate synthase n=1 Tax=Gulosibacter faecalis TaxID=272240 RepID=A0ABW5UXA1_9MICO|nr:Mur ligase family protein [Gulosibacter faecalis]
MSDERRGDEFGDELPEGELTAEDIAKLLGGSPFDDGLDFDTDFADDLVAEEERLSEREAEQRRQLDETDWEDEADQVFQELMERVGEGQPQPRLEPTRRVCELLGDIHRAWPMIHITGTNGKSSTARIAESLLRAHGLRTGLLTSPHLVRLNERIGIDGLPISDERLVANWRDIEPFLAIVDAELEEANEVRLTFFEALTVLAFACFTDAPVDVAIVEVGMGGEWDSTNVADGGVAVFTPISLDHQGRLGDTITEIARTKAGIIKPGAAVVSAAQPADAAAEIAAAAAERDATVYAEPDAFAVTADHMAVGGRLISVRGINGQYDDLPLAIAGEYQAHNAALALAAVEAFFGGERELLTENVEAGIAEALSPGRLELVGANPAVVVDAAHNPHGAAHLAQAVNETYAFDQLTLVLAVLEDKNVEGIVRPLANIADRIIVTQSDSPRAIAAYDLAEMVRDVLGEELSEQKQVRVIDRSDEALATARAEAAAFELGEDEYGLPQSAGVLVTGSITLIGEAYALAHEQGWKQAPSEGEE